MILLKPLNKLGESGGVSLSTLRSIGIQLVLFCLGTWLALHTLIFRLHQVAPGDSGDTRLNFYFLKWASDFLLGRTEQDSIYDLPIFYPLKGAIGFSDNLWGNIPLFLPAYWLTDNMYLAGNIWYVSCFVLKFISFNIFLRYFKAFDQDIPPYLREVLIGILAIGFVYALPNANFSNHPQTWPSFLLPIIIVLFHAAWKTLRVKYFVLLGLTAAYQFWLGIQLGQMALYWLMFAFLAGGVLYRTEPKKLIRLFYGGVIFSAVYLISVSPLLPPYLDAIKLVGPRSLGEHSMFAPRLLQLLHTSNSHLYPQWLSLSSLADRTNHERGVFISLFWLLCLIVGIIQWKRLYTHKYWVFACASLGIMVAFCIYNSPIMIFFFKFIPGYNAIRTPGRFIFMALPFAYLMSALVVHAMLTRRKWGVLVLLAIALGTDLYGWRPGTFQFKYLSPDELALGEALNGRPILFLPFASSPFIQMDQNMLASTTWAPTVDGYSGYASPVLLAIKSLPPERQDNQTIFIIENLGIQNVVVEDSETHWKDKITSAFPDAQEIKFGEKILLKLNTQPNPAILKQVQQTPMANSAETSNR